MSKTLFVLLALSASAPVFAKKAKDEPAPQSAPKTEVHITVEPKDGVVQPTEENKDKEESSSESKNSDESKSEDKKESQ